MELENKGRGDGGIEGGVKEREVEEVGKKRDMRVCDVVLRFLAVAFSLAAAAVLGVNKETANVPVKLAPTLPPMNVPATSKWHYVFAFVVFVVANATACCYAAISLLVTLAKSDGRRWMSMMIIFLDLVMVALLFYADGAAFAVGLLGLKGNSHVQWRKVCNVFDKFCNEATVAVALSAAAALAFFFLVLLATLNKH